MKVWFINATLMFCCTISLLAAGAGEVIHHSRSRQFWAAVQAYKENKYREALTKLSLLPEKEADSPEAHYYSGLSYLALHQYENARKEFMWNYMNRQDKELAYKSWQALHALPESSKEKKSPPKGIKKSMPAVPGDGWIYAKPGFGGTGKDSAALPDDWTWHKTAEGCGRH